MKVLLTLAARRELSEAGTYYAQHSGDALAQSFIEEFERALALIGTHPRIGSTWLRRYRRVPLDRFPFNVVYRITTTEVRILAVAHQRCDPGYWLGRT